MSEIGLSDHLGHCASKILTCRRAFHQKHLRSGRAKRITKRQGETVPNAQIKSLGRKGIAERHVSASRHLILYPPMIVKKGPTTPKSHCAIEITIICRAGLPPYRDHKLSHLRRKPFINLIPSLYLCNSFVYGFDS